MRIFLFDAQHQAGHVNWHCPRYIDLDHVQQITKIDYYASPATVEKDGDGIDVPRKAFGRANFSYSMMFQEKWCDIQLSYPSGRYEYPENSHHAFENLERMRIEYERFVNAWQMRKKSTRPDIQVL